MTFFQDLLDCGSSRIWWHHSSLSPAYSHMPKDYYSIMTALLQYRENMQISKSTPLYYLLAVKEKIHVGPWIENTSTLSTSCLKASVIQTVKLNGELLWHFNRMSSPSLSLYLSFSVSLTLSLSLTFMNN